MSRTSDLATPSMPRAEVSRTMHLYVSIMVKAWLSEVDKLACACTPEHERQRQGALESECSLSYISKTQQKKYHGKWS